MSVRKDFAVAATWIWTVAVSVPVLAGYHLERITPVLNQPTYLTQAPGDPAHIVYYTTRISSSNSGFSAVNTMGKVWRYDLATRTPTVVLDLSSRLVINDDGLHVIAFHPGFNASDADGHGKMYVSSAESGPTALNSVEEFTLLNSDGSLKSPSEVFNTRRGILAYSNSSQNNHTVGWIGFDPNASLEERDYLYVSTGDGAFGNNYNGGSGVNGRPSQNPSVVAGKILRIDVSGADDYPADPDKNFAIPSSNPIPAYNAAYPGSPISGLGEVYATGLRNGYRAGFDRATGDLYWGDVGETSYEEVNFLKAGSNTSGPPADYGWPQLEATHSSTVSGAPHTTVNPFTGVTSRYPIQEYVRALGQAAIGGYVYRGPIPELQGMYFYSDFVSLRVWMLDFDRDTAPGAYNGANGTITNVAPQWTVSIVDPADPSYAGDPTLSTLPGLDHIVSFGEDNQGNLYLVDFGYGVGFNGQYTANGGEIFRLVYDIDPPVLNYTDVGSGLEFTWSGNFRLQETNNLAGAGADWTDVPGGETNPVIVPFDAAEDAEYFRLISPP